MSYKKAIFRSASAMMGNWREVWEMSLMSSIHLAWPFQPTFNSRLDIAEFSKYPITLSGHTYGGGHPTPKALHDSDHIQRDRTIEDEPCIQGLQA